jgi:putative ABC transport system permease protein
VNLAFRDLRRQKARFGATALGLGLLFAVVLAMTGIYRGMVEDATLLVDRMGADLWVVQRDTRGPFAERSTVPPEWEDRLMAVAGVRRARSFSTAALQRDTRHGPLRMTIVGLAWPADRGQGLPLVAGRPLDTAHRELVADLTLGLGLDETLVLGDETYRVVGLTRGMSSSSGDGLLFASELDARAIINAQAPEARRMEREARQARLFRSDLDTPALEDRLRDERAVLPVLAPLPANAILLDLEPGSDADRVARELNRWPDLAAFTAQGQRDLLLKGVVEKSRQQLGLFRAILGVVSGIVVGLIIYTMTVAKTHDIALLKLMGARVSVVVKLVAYQALLLGAIGYGFALVLSVAAFPHFPRRVALGPGEYLGVGAFILILVLAASAAGIARALRIPATLILAG